MQQTLNFTDWFESNHPIFDRLAPYVGSVLSSLLTEANIAHLSVTHRVKDLKSATEKVARKGYADPMHEMTDIVGIRIITYIEADTQGASEVVKSAFAVHDDKSLDKSTELGVDKIGYRSIHYVCDIGPTRGKLPECGKFKDLLFEIQIRSVLQHAWAEIEHDRDYKFSGALPPRLDRRFNLIAGSLELADFEFNTLASELDAYAKTIAEKTARGDLDLELDATTIEAVLKAVGRKLTSCEQINTPIKASTVQELLDFGILKASDLNTLFTDKLVQAINRYITVRTSLGLIRLAMFWHDLDKYFSKAWKKDWKWMTDETYRLLAEHYGVDKLKVILEKHPVKLLGQRKKPPTKP